MSNTGEVPNNSTPAFSLGAMLGIEIAVVRSSVDAGSESHLGLRAPDGYGKDNLECLAHNLAVVLGGIAERCEGGVLPKDGWRVVPSSGDVSDFVGRLNNFSARSPEAERERILVANRVLRGEVLTAGARRSAA